MSSLYEDLEALVTVLNHIIEGNEATLKEDSLDRDDAISLNGFKESTYWRVKEITELLEKHNPDRLGEYINQNWESP